MREYSVTLKQHSPKTPKSLLDRLQQIAQIASLVALPLIVAIGGWFIHAFTSKGQTQQKYVELAISILREPPSESNTSLRGWAARTLSRFSAEAFTSEELKNLESGKTVLPHIIRTEQTQIDASGTTLTKTFYSDGMVHEHLQPPVGGGSGRTYRIEKPSTTPPPK